MFNYIVIVGSIIGFFIGVFGIHAWIQRIDNWTIENYSSEEYWNCLLLGSTSMFVSFVCFSILFLEVIIPIIY